ncbi:MAG TPA: hypothetical protein DET40_14600 [Lentisphaeria bacterium]|nr:MAG: hypothetical protein A2X45_05770 [Lentisphaerae bacterium GWF2_50_93]HCE44768.1 hypothetical protein [Lentisphaeria bacterium]
MERLIKNIDVLDENAEALIYSTNIMLNCTGGVGACLAVRYGRHVQKELHDLLNVRGSRFASQGEVFEHVCSGMPYRKLFHTVPCDAMYNTSPEIVEDILHRCLRQCAVDGIEKVSMSVLATGYGHLDFEDFFRIADRVVNNDDYKEIERIVICIADLSLYEQALELIKREKLRLEPKEGE